SDNLFHRSPNKVISRGYSFQKRHKTPEASSSSSTPIAHSTVASSSSSQASTSKPVLTLTSSSPLAGSSSVQPPATSWAALFKQKPSSLQPSSPQIKPSATSASTSQARSRGIALASATPSLHAGGGWPSLFDQNNLSSSSSRASSSYSPAAIKATAAASK